MGFFKKMFGGSSFQDERAEGDSAFDAGDFQTARASFERALDRKKGATPDEIAHCEERMAVCLDRMAELHIEEAERLVEVGDLDLAEEELRHAMELGSSDEVVKRARRRLETLEKEDAVRQAEAPEELSDEDRWAILAGTWEDEQLDEYEEYGEPMRQALLTLHDGDVESGRDQLEAILAGEEEPLYLWLEVGRARMLNEQWESAEEAFRSFIDQLEDEEGGESRLAAHANLALLRDRADDEEGAMEEYGAAMEAFPDDPRPFLLMGRYLRETGAPSEAVEVLEAALPLLDDDRPDWTFLEALGLALHDAGRDDEAGVYLDQVISFFVSRRRADQSIDYPPATAVARAEIFEAQGRLEKAADLWRGLSSGGDKANHLLYHRETARLVRELGLDEEARRMLTRALALAEDDEAVKGEIEAQLAELEG
ncbi:MAG: hypothetical protein SangKO_063850 [Sandaracinaceae bacterium]